MFSGAVVGEEGGSSPFFASLSLYTLQPFFFLVLSFCCYF
jgi:hypothetical protein